MPSWLTMTMNLRSSITAVGAFISLTAAVYYGSARIPSWSMMCPRNLRLVFENSHFSGFKVAPDASIFVSVVCRRWSCSSLSRPKTRTSSIWQSTPSSPSRMELIRLWKCSGALAMPKGSLFKQYLPTGVMNVVRRLEAGKRGICQNQLFASNLRKSLAQ